MPPDPHVRIWTGRLDIQNTGFSLHKFNNNKIGQLAVRKKSRLEANVSRWSTSLSLKINFYNSWCTLWILTTQKLINFVMQIVSFYIDGKMQKTKEGAIGPTIAKMLWRLF